MNPLFCRSNKLKVEACEKGSAKHRKLFNLAVNYLYVCVHPSDLFSAHKKCCRYRYGTLIVFANYLIETREEKSISVTFPEWLSEHREITKMLGRRSLD